MTSRLVNKPLSPGNAGPISCLRPTPLHVLSCGKREAVMKLAIFFTVVLLAIAPLTAAKAQSVDDANAIRDVIEGQIAAMGADDWDKAFSYASPMIQGIFRSPDNFSQMVTKGYPMVWHPKRFEAGALVETPKGLNQTMFFEDQNGRLYIADYLMAEIDGVWRINGVQIRPAAAESA
jgi:hypothetical protein